MEPIAIVGMACRFPRAPDLAAYWRLLVDGVEAVADPPPNRPELEPPPWLVEQTASCRRGGFLDNVDQFEPGFFRISPREAARMDPQQRLLLEVAWEALEDAGQPVARLAGTTSGVFVGVMNSDFARRAAHDLSQLDAQLGPGSSLGIAPNRISFSFDLRGPSMAIDTLCSSSLVAIHLACQSLRDDESAPLALAGGVNVILDRTMDVFYARAGLLSADGRCRAFDANARGIVRGEGAAMLVLKRLSRARADGDRVHAVILGSAVNQDGRSNGLTSPNRWAQEDVLRAAYRRAGVEPRSVSYVETHGTGTLIGDPIEAAALGAVLGEGRANDHPCAIGSVKTNLGHLESAAGIASTIKAALSLKHRMLAPSLHFEAPNPYARLAERGLSVATRARPFTERVIGVSSFGMGGTNAHLVLGGADDTEIDVTRDLPRARLVPISARSPAALAVLEQRVMTSIASSEHRLTDTVHSVGTRRDHHDHRRAIVLTPEREVASEAAGTVIASRSRKLVFVTLEAGECGADHGDDLANDEPIFRGALAQSLAHGASRYSAVQTALLALWRSYGFEPDAIVKTIDAAAACLDEETVFVELAPLAGLRELGGARVLSSPASRTSILRAVAELYCLGFDVAWKAFDEPDARFVTLGSYPWQRERCWLDALPPPKSSVLPAGVLVPSWIAAPLPTARADVGEWVVTGGGDDVAAALERGGHRVRRTLDAVANERGVIHFCDVELASTIRLVQTLAARVGGASPRLWLVTRGANPIGDDATLEALASATIWGFGRVAANEHPRLHCTLVDLAAQPFSRETEMLVAEVLGDSDEREVALRAIGRSVARVERRLLERPTSPLRLRADAAYLVTGGLGGLGIAAARRLIDRGARNVVLLSRRGVTTDEARTAIAELASRGANVVVEHVDVTDRDALANVLKAHLVRGVIHAAGVMTPAMISAVDPDQITQMLAAKVDGARNLHELTSNESLDFFVLYSSVATLLGMPGQSVYAAGNAYLDALAGYRRSIGLPATSIAWTVIEDTGMAAAAGGQALGQLVDRGLASLPIRSATDLLEELLASSTPPHIGAVAFDVRKWSAFYPHAKAMPRLQPLADAMTVHTKTSVIELRAMSTTARVAEIERFLGEIAATVLHLDAPPAAQRSLLDVGIDSLTALELQAMIEAELELELASERLLRGPSFHELATELAAQLGGETVVETRPSVVIRVDAELDPALGFTRREPSQPHAIFLTGATGFLGAFVLAELLARTDAQIRCLVRAQSPADGTRRLEEILGRYDIPALDLRARVACVPGDLAKPRFGLSDEAFGDLAATIDTIVHSGAAVNFVFPYEALRASNVNGTLEVLRLASAARARMHHVSTIGVFPGGRERLATIDEGARPAEPDQLTLGYMKAKWVAEELVVQARDRGLDVSIFRPGTIAGHSRSGAFNPDDFVCALIKGCIQLGVAPRVHVPINLAPVDYVSGALVRIALGAPSGTYHLVGRQTVSWLEIVEWIRALGYRLRELPYHEWRSLIIEHAEKTRNALAPLLSLFVEYPTTDWLHLAPYDDARTLGALGGDSCPVVDAATVRRYVERFVVSGYLPRPHFEPL